MIFNYHPGLLLLSLHDEDITSAQRDALTQIITGAVGGPPTSIYLMREHDHDVKFVKIDFDIDGQILKLNISDIVESEIKIKIYQIGGNLFINLESILDMNKIKILFYF